MDSKLRPPMPKSRQSFRALPVQRNRKTVRNAVPMYFTKIGTCISIQIAIILRLAPIQRKTQRSVDRRYQEQFVQNAGESKNQRHQLGSLHNQLWHPGIAFRCGRQGEQNPDEHTECQYASTVQLSVYLNWYYRKNIRDYCLCIPSGL